MSPSTTTTLHLSSELMDVSYDPSSKILHSVYLGEGALEVEDITKMLDLELMLVNGERHAKIVSFKSGFISPTKKAREYATEKLKEMNRVSSAFVVDLLPVRLIINTFISINKPHIPMRVFNNVKAAEDWSLEMLREDA